MNSRRRRSIKSTKRVRNPWKEPTPTHSRGSNRKLPRRERRRRREERLLRYLNKFPGGVNLHNNSGGYTKRLPTPIMRGRHRRRIPRAFLASRHRINSTVLSPTIVTNVSLRCSFPPSITVKLHARDTAASIGFARNVE